MVVDAMERLSIGGALSLYFVHHPPFNSPNEVLSLNTTAIRSITHYKFYCTLKERLEAYSGSILSPLSNGQTQINHAANLVASVISSLDGHCSIISSFPFPL